MVKEAFKEKMDNAEDFVDVRVPVCIVWESTVEVLGSRGLSQVGVSLDWDQEQGMVKENRLHGDWGTCELEAQGVILFIYLAAPCLTWGRQDLWSLLEVESQF